jgi:oligosaccharyltransferase complex subunit alpha (ribophorin I)
MGRNMNVLMEVFVVLILAILGHCAQESNFEISVWKREIYLRGKYVRIANEIQIKNTGPRRSKQYYHAVHGNYSKNLIDLLAFSKGYIELQKSFDKIGLNNASIYKVELPYAIDVGASYDLQILELYKNRLTPKPEKLPLSSDEQTVEFIDNLYAYSIYPVISQEVSALLPNLNKIEYYTEKDAMKAAKTQSIHYGPLLGGYKEEELRFHYEHPTPLIYFPKVERQIVLSHLGSISVDEHIELKNYAAGLEGEFSRLKYNTITSYHQGGHIFRKMNCQLPRKAFGLYYTDVIGNVSTSYASREVLSTTY